MENVIQRPQFTMDLMEDIDMLKKILILVLLIPAFTIFAFAQFPSLRHVQVYTNIIHNSGDKMFYYNYSLTNSDSNNGDIDEWEIDISRKPGMLDIDTIGLQFENDRFTEGSFRRNFPFSKGKIVPVGFLKTPGGSWTGMLTNNFTASFNGVGKDHILLGKTLTGFEIMSKGLPGIRYCVIAPYFDFDSLFSGEQYQDQDSVNTDSIQAAGKYYGWTIGPTAPPINIIATEWCDTLTSYTTQSRTLDWIKDDATTNKYLGYFTSAKTKLVQKDSVGARTVLLQVLHDVVIDRTASLSSEAYALLRFNTEYLVNILPQAQAAPFFAVKLISSSGAKLTSGSLQYYDGAWKDATNNNDGTFFVNTSLKTISLRMTYEYGTQTKSNVPISTDTIVFQTINTQVQLQNSGSTLIDTGTVQYYAGAWRTLGTTANGVATKELLPASYSFRMTYAYASHDKQQDISTNPVVIFKTVNANVQLQNSQGNEIDTGVVQYYSGAWRNFGVTSNGIATKELLPNSYSFRMNYASASKDKQQDITANPTVVFQTVNAAVQLKNSLGTFIDTGVVTILFRSLVNTWNDNKRRSNQRTSTE